MTAAVDDVGIQEYSNQVDTVVRSMSVTAHARLHHEYADQ